VSNANDWTTGARLAVARPGSLACDEDWDMDRLRTLRSLTAMLAASVMLTACGGGSHSAVVPGAGQGTGGKTLRSQSVTFVFTVPKTVSSRVRTAGNARTPQYVSAATKSISIALTHVTNAGNSQDITPGTLPPALVVNVPNGTGSAPGGPCVTDPLNAGNYKCTASDMLYVGNDSLTIKTFDGSGATGNVLSEFQPIETVVQGAANSFAVSLDANASTMTVSGTAACATGPVGASFGSVGTTPVNFTVAYTDPATKTIVGPGLPTLAIQDNTATYQTSTGTINGTGGTVSFSINQAAQTFTLTPSSSSVTNATVNVNATPHTAGDGLPFNKTQSFTFSTGPAPPASFLAVVEQLGTSSGKIDLYTVSLGASDTFTPYTVSGGGTSLAVTNSTNENKPDVDNPRDLLFDGNGDLLIANGGQGGAIVAGSPDYGDMACVPAGAIATGSTTTTTTSGNAKDPESIAIGTDSSVALGNVPASAAYDLIEDVFGTTYTPAPTSRDIANSGSLGDTAVVALSTSGANPAGTFATAITDGASVSKVAIKRPNGSETDITDSTIADPDALGFDAANNQLVIANFNTNASYLDFYSVGSTPAQVKALLIRDDGAGNSQVEGAKVAVSPNGYVAVGGISSSGNPEVLVYDNTAARNMVGGGPIPFDSTTTSCGATYIYGQTVVVEGLRFLTNTKLLVALYSSTAAKQGIYTYDITQTQTNTGFDGITCSATPNSVKQTGFVNFATNPPLGAAYKP
jgi:hypothetical protein